MNTRRLYRSRYDKQLAGVAGGMAEYLELDPTLVRILWILSVFLGGFTILLYIILAFIMPLAPAGPVQGGPGGRGLSWAPAGSWGPGGAPVAGAAPAAGPTGASASEAGGEGGGGDAAGATADASPTQGWETAQAGWVDPAWTGSQTWTAPALAPEVAGDRRRGPGAAVYAGILLVVFGAIALADSVIPGLAGFSLGPALLVALGAALLIGSIRRSADEGA
jgi:phage shock protein C